VFAGRHPTDPLENPMNAWTRSAAATLSLFAATALAQPAMPSGVKSSGGMLVNATGMTLYTFDKDAAGKSNCNGPCATNWPPLMAEAAAKPSGDWTVVTRDDGGKQWAYKGKPLYLWIKDTKPGDATGEGMANNTWHVAKP
jgi:predicted lipoprotein with Yx(FWY)xxD motif